MVHINHFPFAKILDWYKRNGRHTLPWRQIYHLPNKERLYHVWIAEVMLQQTQVDRVIGYYPRFLEKYPTIESLAATTYEELFPYYQGLGYYGRARRMIELAQRVVKEYDGIFPETFEVLRKLPGIGTYTAQALLAFGYNQSILAFDANLEKIFSRYYFGTKSKKMQYEGKNIVTALQQQVQKDTISGRDINNALMDFGALISTPNFAKIDKETYPIPECIWFQTQGRGEILQKKQRKDSLTDTYTCIVFLHENHQKYWSSRNDIYEPFLIHPIEKDDRKSIQDYFTATYGLEVSVRPSFGNARLISGLTGVNPKSKQTVKLFHAQIQTGNKALKDFRKGSKDDWMSQTLIIF